MQHISSRGIRSWGASVPGATLQHIQALHSLCQVAAVRATVPAKSNVNYRHDMSCSFLQRYAKAQGQTGRTEQTTHICTPLAYELGKSCHLKSMLPLQSSCSADSCRPKPWLAGCWQVPAPTTQEQLAQVSATWFQPPRYNFSPALLVRVCLLQLQSYRCVFAALFRPKSWAVGQSHVPSHCIGFC